MSHRTSQTGMQKLELSHCKQHLQHMSDTTGFELDCDILQTQRHKCVEYITVEMFDILHGRCISTVARQNVNTLRLSRCARHLIAYADRHNLLDIEYSGVSAQTVCNHGILPISYTWYVGCHHVQALKAKNLPMMTDMQNKLTQFSTDVKQPLLYLNVNTGEEGYPLSSGCPTTGNRGRRGL